MTKTEQTVRNLVKPTVEQLGYKLYDVEYVKEGKDYFLRIYIDAEKGIDLDDCEKVSNALDPILDEADPISTAYSLEVSSCGLERHLREKEHYEEAIGKKVEVKLFKALEGEKQFTGILKSTSENTILLELENNKEVEIYLEEIAAAKILFDWEELENE
ncbi:MAG: ribosome maturation factor RimP [Clostridia bacterium]|nr:ribosome maturation factor RimP [Clostridia bacterium]MBR2290120.1 ribosome maturation factor RimP [Clostridia bacterium]